MRNFLLLILLGCLAAAHNVVNISTARNSKMHELSSLVIEEAYKKAGIELRIHVLPTENALAVANAGIVDGEISRPRDIRQTYSNLLRVPVEINYIEGVVFSRDPKMEILGWSSIAHYRIAIVKGCDFATKGTRGMRVKVMNSDIQAFEALEAKSVDIVVLPLVDGLQTLQTLKMKGVYALRPSLVHIPLYHYIHNSHSDLIPPLTKVLREMKESGRIETIRQGYLGKLMLQL